MFNLRLCNAATIRYSLLKFGHMHLCGINYKKFSPHCCKCNSLGCTAAIRCGSACHGPHNDSVYSGSEHNQFDSPRLVKCEAGFPNARADWAQHDLMTTQRTQDAKISSLYVRTTSFWRKNDDIMTSCARWETNKLFEETYTRVFFQWKIL